MRQLLQIFFIYLHFLPKLLWTINAPTLVKYLKDLASKILDKSKEALLSKWRNPLKDKTFEYENLIENLKATFYLHNIYIVVVTISTVIKLFALDIKWFDGTINQINSTCPLFKKIFIKGFLKFL